MGNLVSQKNKNRDFLSVTPLTDVEPTNEIKNVTNKQVAEVRVIEANTSNKGQISASSEGAHLTLTEEHLINNQLTSSTNVEQRVSNSSARQDSGANVEPFTPGHGDFTLTESQQRRNRMADSEFECSEIYPYLFVAGHHVAGNKEMLKNHGITHVVNCSAAVVENYFEGDKELNLKYLSLSMVDGRQDDISWFFCDVIAFIMEAMTSGGRALVHCEKGISRSCSFIIAYRMWVSGESWKESFAFVKKRRKVCSPNTTFTCNLIEIGELINKNSAVATISDAHGESGGSGGGLSELPLLFRCAYHLPHDHKTAILKICRRSDTRKLVVPATSILDPRGVFVLRVIGRKLKDSQQLDRNWRKGKQQQEENPYHNNEHFLYLWQGKLASTETALKASKIAERFFGVLSRTKNVIWVKQGKEPAEFMEYLIKDGDCKIFEQTATGAGGEIQLEGKCASVARSLYHDYYDYPPSEEEIQASKKAMEADHTVLQVPSASRESSLTLSHVSSLRGASFTKQLSNNSTRNSVGENGRTPVNFMISRESSVNRSNNSLIMRMANEHNNSHSVYQGEEEQKSGDVASVQTPANSRVPLLQGALGESLAALAAKRDSEYPLSTSRRGSGSSTSRRGSGSEGPSATMLSLQSSRTTSLQLPRIADEETSTEDDNVSKDTRILAYAGPTATSLHDQHICTVRESNRETDEISTTTGKNSEQNSPRMEGTDDIPGNDNGKMDMYDENDEINDDKMTIRVAKSSMGRCASRDSSHFMQPKNLTVTEGNDASLVQRKGSDVSNYYISPVASVQDFSAAGLSSMAGLSTMGSSDLDGTVAFSVSGASIPAESPTRENDANVGIANASNLSNTVSEKEDAVRGGVGVDFGIEEQKGSTPLKKTGNEQESGGFISKAPSCDPEDRNFLRKSSFKLFGSISGSRPNSRPTSREQHRRLINNKVAPLVLHEPSSPQSPQEVALTTGGDNNFSQPNLSSRDSDARSPSSGEKPIGIGRILQGNTSRSVTPLGLTNPLSLDRTISPRPGLPLGSSRTGTPIAGPTSSRSNQNSQSKLDLPLRLLARTPSVERHPTDVGLSRGPTPIEDLTPERLSAGHHVSPSIPPTAPRSGTPLAPIDDVQHDETCMNKPTLYQAVPGGDENTLEWQSMGVYDDEDLLEDCLMLLICPNEPHYLWVGTEYDFKSNEIGLIDDNQKLINWVRSIEHGECNIDVSTATIIIEREGEESDNFWTQFNEGF